ncbi:DeoR/GlpR family DNA-binding transcription regulator [Fulvivirgaceae bacterium BMA12]|uniref:DeoR/GlpR family DNA-binding transcription regulator n=1 Tax=Agaribacillus aureus TaxID=3051825 RepID=A0ABT8L8W1_9BACT|nr:DeoR/GlpR family DNA-binding transcription regulator [Fulvivirgaceae bacterium BMA12]
MTKKEERHKTILHEVEIHNRLLLGDLAHILKVSTDTVRRDIKELDEAGKLKKVHGGAISNGFQLIGNGRSKQNVYAYESKLAIAGKAIKLIEQNSVVLMSGGTTNIELAKQLPAKLNATVFTPSLPIAVELLAHPGLEVILIGGRLSHDAQIAIGGQALNTLFDIKVDICFLGTGYLDHRHGLTEFDWDVVQIKKAMIGASRQVISLNISEKLNSVQRYKICDIQSINTLITELDPDAEVLKPYRRQRIKIL